MSVFCFFIFIYVSCNENEKSECELYCESLMDCYKLLDNPFSISSCNRECKEDLERYSSVGCRDRFFDLIECKTDLSCSDASNVSEECSPEIRYLSRCVE